MADEKKPAFDPDATVSQPLAESPPGEPDPDATFTGAAGRLRADPDATIGFDPEATDRIPVFDPDATVNSAEQVKLDPESTVRIPSPGKQQRPNPFAPQARPESLQTSLAALGGINPLAAMLNPILGAVPQIRRTLRHPDPARLKASLQDQLEGFQMSAMSADVPDPVSHAALYATCALLDESAAATPWGTDWIEHGLLQEMCNDTGGAEGFFNLLDRTVTEAPEVKGGSDEYHADLLELFFICLALGFEGRYRGSDGGRRSLQQIRDRLYSLIASRRPRPIEGLSEHWRTPAAQAQVDAALATAAKVTAARNAAEEAAKAPHPPVAAVPPSFLSRLPRRAIWSAVGGIVGAAIVLSMLAQRLLEDDENTALAGKPARGVKGKSTQAGKPPEPPAAAVAATSSLSSALAGLPVSFAEGAGGTTISFRHDRQFPSGGAQPAKELQPLIAQVAQALDKLPGTVVVTGHSDATPVRAQSPAGSNEALSEARAQAVARLLAAKMADPKRVRAEGKGDSAPLAPGDTPENKAKNRRIEIIVRPGP